MHLTPSFFQSFSAFTESVQKAQAWFPLMTPICPMGSSSSVVKWWNVQTLLLPCFYVWLQPVFYVESIFHSTSGSSLVLPPNPGTHITLSDWSPYRPSCWAEGRRRHSNTLRCWDSGAESEHTDNSPNILFLLTLWISIFLNLKMHIGWKTIKLVLGHLFWKSHIADLTSVRDV